MVTWNRKFLDWLGHPLPDDYLAFDCETQGLKRDWALPVEIGHCLVRGRKPVNQGNFVLNWIGYPGVDEDWLDHTLKKTAFHMSERGKPYKYTLDYLRRHGRDPVEVIGFYYKLFKANRNAGAKFVGHNAWFFDCELLTNVFLEACGLRWTWGDNEVYDSGGMEKALLADLEPFYDEHTLRQYFLRIHHAPKKGLYWNIEACVERYKMEERFGLSMKDLHGTAEDSFVCHLLFEEHRNTE